MKANKILIVPKITKVEWDMKRLNLNESQLREFYKKEGLNSERIFDSHKRQKASLAKIKEELKGATLIQRDEMNKKIAEEHDIVISFGGDNHFQYISHFCTKTSILGINSDPERSEGALTSVNAENINEIVNSILNNNFHTEEWIRLKVNLNGDEIEDLAISEVYIGEERRFNMSRHILTLNGRSEEQKGSGILITTGAGSTGWYNSASRYLFPNGNSFSKTEKEAKFILTEPYNGRLSTIKNLYGSFKENQELEIIELSDSSPYLSIDSLKLIKLKEGAKIKITLGKPLKVIIL